MRSREASVHFSLPVVAIAITLFTATGTVASDHYPDDAIVARFTIPASALDDVHNVADLAEALHKELKLEASSPLDFEVVVHMVGNVYQNWEQQPHSEGSGIMVNLEKGKPVNNRIKDLRFYTYGDFSESEAWDFFRGKIQEALLYSMNSNGAFEVDDHDNVWLAVVDVVDGTRRLEVDSTSMVLELSAELLYRDGSKFGSKEPPEGYREFVRSVQLVLSPAEAQTGEENEAEEVAPAAATEAAAEESDGLTGIYGFDQSGMLIEKKDGQYYLSNPSASEERFVITPTGEHQFDCDYDGMPMTIKFSVDDDGHAFAVNMTYVEYGNTVKLPRK